MRVADDGVGLSRMGAGTGLANVRATCSHGLPRQLGSSLQTGGTGGCAHASSCGAGRLMTRPTAIIGEDEAPQRQELRALFAELWPELT